MWFFFLSRRQVVAASTEKKTTHNIHTIPIIYGSHLYNANNILPDGKRKNRSQTVAVSYISIILQIANQTVCLWALKENVQVENVAE